MNPNVKLDKKNDIKTIRIESLSHDGRGIATIDNKKMFVEGALTNELVNYQITHQHKSYNEALAVLVLEPSAKRVAPFCKHFSICGGCSLQHMDETAQLSFKEEVVLNQLKHFGQVVPEHVLPPLTANTFAYRRKARLGVKFVHKKNKVLVGFREKSSRYLADLDECPILHDRIGHRLQELQKLISSLDLYNQIPQIEVAIGDTEIALVIRHLADFSSQDKEKLIHFADENQFQIYLQPNPPAPILKLWPKDGIERLSYSLPQEQLTFLFYPLDFTQINLELNRAMIKQALYLLDLQQDDIVLDLFCGIGNFSLPLAKYAKRVVGVEGSADMVMRAKENALHNHLDNLDFYVTNLIEPTQTSSWMQIKYNKILLDPPRAGAKEMLPYLHKLSPQKILYVSCNPATLARDAGELVHRYGYQLQQAGIMNMFPQTSHIEVMALFVKK